ncbi:MAG: hypothetical protein PHP26_02815 [Syntrophomonas sp.]|uniref:hypothetical protein n=1 Tax=Syntrophomonas sp. TaxID=2053627 RepID=UPI002629A280|nr:hypothetical protein [Syntrophomonas sp.]MDD2511007.1 hypothetical protein [Syntrophomonas sp.]MDD3878907.1 hypothetical protein [Syntrophomonas sp.]MDD4626880.1 hypothetical protein [Syntrophomonas sp.]
MSLMAYNDWPLILENYRSIQDSPDLFSFWQEELRLRQRGRNLEKNPQRVLIKQAEELDFLLRSMYFSGQQQQFFNILLQNMHLMFVLQWMLDSPRYVLEAFLDYLPWYLSSNRIKKRNLLFLIQIYQESFKDKFRAIINTLDAEACGYIAARTASPELRELIKLREEELEQSRKENYYAIKRELYKNNLYPSIFGDKIELFVQAIDSIEATSPEHFTEPYGAPRFLSLLETAELVFQCGWPEDSLAILLDVYEDYQQKNRLVKVLDDENIYRHFHKVLRRVIPIYSLLFGLPDCLVRAKNIYQHAFPRILPDTASLQYLAIYESVLAGLEGVLQYPQWDIIIKSSPVRKYRPAEPPLLLPNEADSGLSPERLMELQELIEQKMASLPHEAFITLEYLRFLQLHFALDMEQQLAQRLMAGYLALWKWLPSSLFMNPSLLEQLGPLLPASDRAEAQKILTFLDDYDKQGLNNELCFRPELFRKKAKSTLREILIGQFAGVW